MTVVHCDAAGHRRALVPAPWNARTRVHEYGGRSYLPVPLPGQDDAGEDGQGVVFANYADQRLYLVPVPGGPAGRGGGRESGPAPRPLTPELAGAAGPAALRFADFILSPGGKEVWCVQERHEAGKVSRAIVAIPLDGSGGQRSGRGPGTGHRRGLLRLPHAVAGRQQAGLDLLESPADAVGRHRTAGRPDNGSACPAAGGWSRAGCGNRCWPRYGGTTPACMWCRTGPGWWNLYQVGLLGEPPQALYPARRSSRSRCGSWAAPVRAARRRPAGRAARPGRHAARPARPGDRGDDRPRAAVPGVHLGPGRGQRDGGRGGGRPGDPAGRGPDQRGQRHI